MLSSFNGGLLAYVQQGETKNLADFIATVPRAESDEKIIKRITTENANDIGRSGFSALCVAAASGRVLVAEKLLDLKAEVGFTDREGITALHIAARKQNADMVRLLLSRGANPSATTKGHITPLRFAVSFEVPKSVEALLMQCGSACFSTNKAITIIELLVNANASVDEKPVEGESLIQCSLRNNFFDVSECLYLAGADASEARNGAGWTLLHIAALHKQTLQKNMIRQILWRGDVDPGITDIYKQTAEQLAIKLGMPHQLKNAEAIRVCTTYKTLLALGLKNDKTEPTTAFEKHLRAGVYAPQLTMLVREFLGLGYIEEAEPKEAEIPQDEAARQNNSLK